MRKKYYYILLMLLATISACKKDSPPPSFTESSYPLAVGNWWQYQFLDIYGGGGYDTFTLTVTSMAQSGPYMKYACNFTYNGNVTDSGYFLVSDTSISFVQPYSYYAAFPSFHLRFPAQTGDKWFGAFPGDTIEVGGVSASDRLSDGQTFGPVYYLAEYYDLPDNYKNESMILTPKIGLVSQSITFNSDTAGKTASYGGGIQIQQSINLISYHVQ